MSEFLEIARENSRPGGVKGAIIRLKKKKKNLKCTPEKYKFYFCRESLLFIF